MPTLSDTIYQAWRVTFNATFPLFYSDIATNNNKTMHFDNGSIVVCNHPCTLMDPLHLAVNSNRSIHFVVNASLYINPISRKFFQTMYSIPIERQEDAKSRGSSKVDNKKSFSVCSDFLINGGSIFMAPQGGSHMERRVRKLKTGAARIALAAASQADFKSGITILPVGLNYSDPRYFRSTILVNSGEHIQVDDYKEAYEQDAFGAAQQITQEIARQMERLMIDTVDEEEDQFARKIETLYESEEKKSLINTFNQSKAIIDNSRKQKEQSPTQFSGFQKKIESYFSKINAEGIKDKTIQLAASNGLPSFIGSLLLLIIGFPFFLYGLINNMIPAYLAKFIALKLSAGSIREYIGTYKFVFGFFGFPLFYALQSWLVYRFTGSWIIMLVYLVSLIPMGLLAWRYSLFAKATANQQKFKGLNESGKAEQFISERKELLVQLTEFNYPNLPLQTSGQTKKVNS